MAAPAQPLPTSGLARMDNSGGSAACREMFGARPDEKRKRKAGGRGRGVAMAGPRAATFPLLVCGDWGAGEPPAALRKKLLLYFQSHKRSGGGECELQGGPGHLLVCFARPDGEGLL